MIGASGAIVVVLIVTVAFVAAAFAWAVPRLLRNARGSGRAPAPGVPGDATVTAVAAGAEGEAATLSVRVAPLGDPRPYDGTLVLQDLAPDSPLRAYCVRGAWIPVRIMPAPRDGAPAVILDLERALVTDWLGRPTGIRTASAQRRPRGRGRSGNTGRSAPRRPSPPEDPGSGPITFY